MGWVLSCETGFSEVLIFFWLGEGNIIACEEWRAWNGPCAVVDPMHVETSFVRNLGGLMPPAAAKRSRASGGSSKERSPAGRYEESDDCIVPRKPRTKPSSIGGGDGGGKAVGRRKGALATHVPDTEPEVACHRGRAPTDRSCMGRPSPEGRSRLTFVRSPVR